MKLEVNRKALLRAVKTAAAAVRTRTPKPIYQCLRIEAEGRTLKVAGTGVELLIEATVDPDHVIVHDGGVTCVPAHKFQEVLASANDESVKIGADDSAIAIRCGGRFRFPTMAASDFPSPPEVAGTEFTAVLAASDFEDLIRKTGFAIERNSSRYALECLLFDAVPANNSNEGQLLVVSTDGRRLAKTECHSEQMTCDNPEGQTLVPAASMSTVAAIFRGSAPEDKLTVRTDKNHLLVTGLSARAWLRLGEGRYPRWRDFMSQPGVGSIVDIDIDPFIQALTQAIIVSSDANAKTTFALSADQLEIKRETTDGRFTTTLQVASRPGSPAESVTFYLDPQYVKEAMATCEGTVRMQVTSPESIMMFYAGENQETLHGIMPLRGDAKPVKVPVAAEAAGATGVTEAAGVTA